MQTMESLAPVIYLVGGTGGEGLGLVVTLAPMEEMEVLQVGAEAEAVVAHPTEVMAVTGVLAKLGYGRIR